MDPKGPLGGQNGFWDQNHVTFSIKMDTKSDPAKTKENQAQRASPKNVTNTIKFLRECEFDPQKTQKQYKTAKKVTTISQKSAKSSKMGRNQVLLENRNKSVNSRAHFANVFAPEAFFDSQARKNDFESGPCEKVKHLM